MGNFARLKYFDGVHQAYHIDIGELSNSLGVNISGDVINFSEIADKTDEELKNLLLTTVSWLEHISYKKSLVKGVILKQKEALNKLKAEKYKEVKSMLLANSDTRVRASDIDSEIDSSTELATHKEKLILYEAYYEYIDSLFEVIHLLHYSIKTLLTNNNDIWKKTG